MSVPAPATELPKCEIAVVGGTGVYELEGMTDSKQSEVWTPFGAALVTIGKFGGENIVFVTRHGLGHKVLPTNVPFRANIYACKQLGVRYMFAVSACGSLRQDYAPGDIVLLDQFIDRTKARESTFFGDGVVGHISFGHPICLNFHKLTEEAAEKSLPGVTVHKKGTYVCMEGPCFSTQAESRMYQKWGGDVIGMTALTEAKLAREAEIAYMCVGLVTDFDAWKDDEPHADVASIMKVIAANGKNAQTLAHQVVVSLLSNKVESEAHTSLASGLMTRGDAVRLEHREKVGVIFGKYW